MISQKLDTVGFGEVGDSWEIGVPVCPTTVVSGWIGLSEFDTAPHAGRKVWIRYEWATESDRVSTTTADGSLSSRRVVPAVRDQRSSEGSPNDRRDAFERRLDAESRIVGQRLDDMDVRQPERA